MPSGLNWTIKSAVPESGADAYEPKSPRIRETVNALIANTITMTIGIQARPISFVIALLSSGPPAAVRGVEGADSRVE
jgi:hypothetical protein